MITLNAKIKNFSKNKKLNNHLRKNKNIPSVIYGKKIKPISIYINYKDMIFLKKSSNIYEYINLKINNLHFISKIQNIQFNILKNKIIHIDFLIK